MDIHAEKIRTVSVGIPAVEEYAEIFEVRRAPVIRDRGGRQQNYPVLCGDCSGGGNFPAELLSLENVFYGCARLRALPKDFFKICGIGKERGICGKSRDKNT